VGVLTEGDEVKTLRLQPLLEWWWSLVCNIEFKNMTRAYLWCV
jgi:hypothetical protein